MYRLIAPLLLVILVIAGVFYSWNKLPWLQTGSGNGEPVAEVPTAPLGPSEPPPTYATGPAPGYLAPDFRLPALSGGEVALSDFLDTPVIVVFWDSKCPFCPNQLTILNRARFTSLIPFVVLAINVNELPMVAADTLSGQAPVPYLRIIIDEEETASSRYNLKALPTLFFVDRRGVIRERIAGEVSLDEVREQLRLLIDPSAAVAPAVE